MFSYSFRREIPRQSWKKSMAEVYNAVGQQDKVVLSFRGGQEVVQHISDHDLKVWAEKIVSDIDEARKTEKTTPNVGRTGQI